MAEDVRKATWLELFYDLIFVVAIAKTVHTLGHAHEGHIPAEYYVKYVLTMVPLWWAWTGYTLFSTRFDTDDVIQRFMTLTQMMCAISLAVFIDPDFDAHYQGFLLSYGAFRGALIVMYWRAAATSETASHVARYLGKGFMLGLAISLSSLLFDGYWKYVILYTGIAVDMLVPIVGRNRLKQAPVNAHHLPERFGLLTIILLGESVAILVLSLEGVVLSSQAAIAAVAGFAWTAAIWWIYYENLEHRIYGRELGTGQATIYLHLLIYIFLGGIANTIRFAIDPALTLVDYKILAGVSTVGFVIALELLHLTYHERAERRLLLLSATTLLALAIAGVALSPSSLVVLLVLAGIFVAYATVDAFRRHIPTA